MHEKIVSILILIGVFLFNGPIVTYAHIEGIDFYKSFEHRGPVMPTSDSVTGDTLHANKAAFDFYGYTVKELEAMKLQDLSTFMSEKTQIIWNEIKNRERHEPIIDHRLDYSEVRTAETLLCTYDDENKAYLIGIVNSITEKIQFDKEERIPIIVLYIMILC